MRKRLLLGLIGFMLAGTVSGMPFASAHHYYDRYDNYRPSSYQQGYSRFRYQHPYLKSAGIGGAGGAVIGTLVAPDGDRVGGAVKGGLLGAGAGLGYEWLRRKY